MKRGRKKKQLPQVLPSILSVGLLEFGDTFREIPERINWRIAEGRPRQKRGFVYCVSSQGDGMEFQETIEVKRRS